jgi:hypothetical protein
LGHMIGAEKLVVIVLATFFFVITFLDIYTMSIGLVGNYLLGRPYLAEVSSIVLLPLLIIVIVYFYGRIHAWLKTSRGDHEVDRRRRIGLYGFSGCTILALLTLLPTASVGLLGYGSLCTLAPISTLLTFLVGVWLYFYGERRTKAFYGTTVILLLGISGASYWVYSASIPLSQVQGNMVIVGVYPFYSPLDGNATSIGFDLNFTNPTSLTVPTFGLEDVELYIDGSMLQSEFDCWFPSGGAPFGLGDHQSHVMHGVLELFLGNGSLMGPTKLQGMNITALWSSILAKSFTLRLAGRLVARVPQSSDIFYEYYDTTVTAASAIDLIAVPQ